jgi:Heterokaryon incompatibility protein (HET)
MRLLRLEDDGEFSPVEFFGKNIPHYAILSHTWGADYEEVTFKDIVKGKGKSKAGYAKIRFCGKQAAKDDLQYFWVDTCCIDKSSSTELSEAINSMFRWYQNAAKCYVYLSDVSIGGSVGNDLSSQQTWKPAFQGSRWFNRGWTLQELVAPTSVEFYSVEGERLGYKDLLVQEIHEITGIAVRALQGSALSGFSVDERMLWAAGRETTREEDAAYSLLGIFDIHMPLLYGEGQEKALIRLQKEIKESLKDELPGAGAVGQRRMEEFVRVGGASWRDLVKLDEGRLRELDQGLHAFASWMLKQGGDMIYKSGEAGLRMKSLLNRVGVSYHDNSDLEATVTNWPEPWSRFRESSMPGFYRVRGYLENRWWWANGTEDRFTGIIAARTLLDLMIWRGLWKP